MRSDVWDRSGVRVRIGSRSVVFIVVFLFAGMSVTPFVSETGARDAPGSTAPEATYHVSSKAEFAVDRARVPGPVGLLDGVFKENVGQVKNEAVRFYGDMGGVRVGFAVSAVDIIVAERTPSRPALGGHPRDLPSRSATIPSGPEIERGVLVQMMFEGSNRVVPKGREELPYRTNYFIGNATEWRTGVRSYREIVYENLYNGIDLFYRSTPEGAKYEFVVHPGADLERLVVAYDEVQEMRVDPGGLVLHTVVGDLLDGPLRAFEDTGEAVPCAFAPRGRRSFS